MEVSKSSVLLDYRGTNLSLNWRLGPMNPSVFLLDTNWLTGILFHALSRSIAVKTVMEGV